MRIIVATCGAASAVFFLLAALAAGTGNSATSPLALLAIGAALLASAWTIDTVNRPPGS
jgi:hypothetical protein